MRTPISIIIAAALTASALSSCSHDQTILDENLGWFTTQNYLDLPYESNGCWSLCYQFDMEIIFAGLHFGHHSNEDGFDAPDAFWNGFCPARTGDRADHSGNWDYWQWSSATGGGVLGEGTAYMTVKWDNTESTTTRVDSASCFVAYWEKDERHTFRPHSVCITNSTIALYEMTAGSVSGTPFGPGDYLHLIVVGERNGTVTARQYVDLCPAGVPLTKWQEVNLTSMGVVDRLYFQMESSRRDADGRMTFPPFFCLDYLRYQK